jgi:hypothetical protein
LLHSTLPRFGLLLLFQKFWKPCRCKSRIYCLVSFLAPAELSNTLHARRFVSSGEYLHTSNSEITSQNSRCVMSSNPGPSVDVQAVLSEILESLKSLQKDNAHLASSIDTINGRVNALAGVKQLHEHAAKDSASINAVESKQEDRPKSGGMTQVSEQYEKISSSGEPASPPRRSSTTSKIILTSYPGQSGVDPIVMNWGHKDPNQRGPVVVSRHWNTIRRRNGTSEAFQLFGKSVLTYLRSHWRSWRLLLHIPRSSRSEQKP